MTIQEEENALVLLWILTEDHLLEDTGKEILALGQDTATVQVKAQCQALSLTIALGTVVVLVWNIAFAQALEVVLCQVQCPVFALAQAPA